MPLTVRYAYRANGLRNSKTVNNVTTTHVWLGMNIVMDIIAENESTNIVRYLRGIGLIAAEGLPGYSERQYYVLDARGSVVQMVNSTGSVTRSYKFDAWGNHLNSDPNDSNPFRFASMYWDTETGTYYTPNRHFNPRTGRWTQPDPIFWGPANIFASPMEAANLFVFVMNNPVRFVDPLGLFAVRSNDDVWFPLRSAVENTPRGSIAWSVGESTATVALWGNTARFNASMDGVRIDSDNRMSVRSDVFARELLNESDFNAGVRVAYKNNRLFKNVTTPVNAALAVTAAGASARSPLFDIGWFYNLVNHDAPWDIKRPARWEETIGTTFPGSFDTPIYFRGSIMTPESLGNWTFGYIGRALGLNLDVLLVGSWYAAGFPTSGGAWENERGDWSYINRGFQARRFHRYDYWWYW